jgi:iron complex outermembrane receptor protein
VQVEVDSLGLPPAPLLEGVLRELPMIHVRTNSRGEAEISARGSESRQVAVLVDGVPITLAWDARADVSVIPATAMQEVVFVRGPSSMLYGPNVLGGVVEMSVAQSLEQPESRSLQVQTGVDHVGAFATAIATALPFQSDGGEWLVRGGVGYRETPGQPLAEDVVEPLPDDDDLRVNTDAENVDGFVALRHRATGGAWFAFSGSSFREERGIPAELGVEDARFWRYPHISRTLAVLSAGTGKRRSPFGGRGHVDASVGYDRGRTEIDSYTSRAYDEIDTFENGKDRTITTRVLASQSLGLKSELRGAFTLADIRHEEIIPEGAFDYRQRLWSFGAENSWRLITGDGAVKSLRATVGGAYDAAQTPEAGGREPLGQLSEWGGRAGLSMSVADGNTVLHAGISRRGRFPALRELYSGSLDRFAPNPDLKPEKLVAIEAGVTRQLGDGELQAVVFHNQTEDAVVRTTLEDGRFMRVNRNELETLGLELFGSHSFGPVALSGEFTLQDPQLTDTDANETHKPENMPKAFGSIGARFPIALGFTGGADVEYTGSQFCIDPGTGEDAELDDGAIVGGFVAKRWPLRASWGGGEFSNIETRIALDNAADVALYDQCGLPRPGQRVRFELRLF